MSSPLQPQWIRASERLPEEASIKRIAYVTKAEPDTIWEMQAYRSQGKWKPIYSSGQVLGSFYLVLYWLEEPKLEPAPPSKELPIYRRPRRNQHG